MCFKYINNLKYPKIYSKNACKIPTQAILVGDF